MLDCYIFLPRRKGEAKSNESLQSVIDRLLCHVFVPPHEVLIGILALKLCLGDGVGTLAATGVS